jgi:uncharacterized membrane protein YhaH (DUF805 family)
MLFLLFSFNGRIGRGQYWFGTLITGFGGLIGQMLVQILAVNAGALSTTIPHQVEAYANACLLLLPLNAAVVWATAAVQCKRFHDRGRPGWLALIPLAVTVWALGSAFTDIVSGVDILAVINNAVPYVCALMLMSLAMLIDLGCFGSVEGPNQYGNGPGSPGPNKPPTAPGAPSPNVLVNAQAAMDRALAQRKAAPVAKSSRPATAFGAAPQPAQAAQPATSSRSFGRRTSR